MLTVKTSDTLLDEGPGFAKTTGNCVEITLPSGDSYWLLEVDGDLAVLVTTPDATLALHPTSPTEVRAFQVRT